VRCGRHIRAATAARPSVAAGAAVNVAQRLPRSRRRVVTQAIHGVGVH